MQDNILTLFEWCLHNATDPEDDAANRTSWLTY